MFTTHTKPDMGLGKTLQSVCLIHTLLKTGIAARAAPTAKRIIVVCPCSLVKNWDNEFVKWLGPGAVKTIALAESDRKTVEKNLDVFVRTKMFNVLIASYETMRTHIGRLTKHKDCCDLLGKPSQVLPYRHKPWWPVVYSSFASTTYHSFFESVSSRIILQFVTRLIDSRTGRIRPPGLCFRCRANAAFCLPAPPCRMICRSSLPWSISVSSICISIRTPSE